MKVVSEQNVIRVANCLAAFGWATGGDMEDFIDDVRIALEVGFHEETDE